MSQDTPETWKDKKRKELISEQMEMAYEPAVPEGSIPLSMIEPLINETVDRILRLSKP